MKSSEIRKRFIDYFVNTLAERNAAHVEVHSSPLVPERHPTLLFVNSGMVQFTPYFLGEKDPVKDFGSPRLCSVQKSFRTGDLDIIGESKYHLTFFEMMGSWSIGDYGKQKAVEYAFDLLTNKNYGFRLDRAKLIPTVFGGNEEVACDTETIKAWNSVGIDNISKLPTSENWWAPAGFEGPGPGGPCTEVLYDRGDEYGPEEESPGLTDNPRYVEIWNAGVFMQFNRDDSGKLNELDIMSVDTGAGLERFAVLMQGVDSVYETDLFTGIISRIKSLGANMENAGSEKAVQRIADHVRGISFIGSESVFPSNTDQGYVLRKLIRNAFNDMVWRLNMDSAKLVEVIPTVFEEYSSVYPELGDVSKVVDMVSGEHNLWKRIADNTRSTMARLGKKGTINAFDLYQSEGASLDLIMDIASEIDVQVDSSNFEEQRLAHQEKSKEGAGQKFKGGLGDHSEETTRLHTATHLLHGALREVLGDHVQQMGSNITPERLRFDFSNPEKLTPEEIGKVEGLVNQKIKESLPVKFETMSKEDAEATGALHFFKEKYGESVKIYYIGNDLDTAWSKEFCGGPHVSNTSELGHFKIQKEESVGKGIRRIRAVVES